MTDSLEIQAASIESLRAALGRMEIALGSIEEAIAWTNERGEVQWCNAVFDRLVDRFHTDVLGADAVELLPFYEHDKKLSAERHPVAAALRQGESAEGTFRLGARTMQVSAGWIRFSPVEAAVVVLLRDVTAAHRAASAMHMLERIATAANEAASPHQVLVETIALFCEEMRWPIGHAHLADEASPNLLVPSPIWHIDDYVHYSELRARVHSMKASNGGYIRRAMETRRPVWVRDLAAEDASEYRDVMLAAGLKSAFAFPIMIDVDVAGVVEFLSERPAPEDVHWMELAANVGTQIGRVFERTRAQARLRRAHADLEERVRARTAELQSSEARYRAVAETASEGILTLDASDRIVYANPAAAEIFGVDGSRLMHQPLSAFAMQGDAPLEIGERGASRVLDANCRRRDGSIAMLEISFGDSLRSGLSESTLIVRDVTDRKEVDRLKNELISIVSHELRTPLTSLRGFAELMLHRKFSPEKQREFLTILVNESDRLTGLINNLLDLQKIEAGKMEYTFEPVDLEALLRESVAVFAQSAVKRTVRLEADPKLPAVRADSGKIKQVVANLLSNACKFSPEASEVVVSAARDGNRVRVSVRDVGAGIPEAAIAQLGSRFYRVDNRETRKVGGSGLGLALVKEIAEKHGGAMHIQSKLGEGSTFSITLEPVHPFCDDADALAAAEPQRRR